MSVNMCVGMWVSECNDVCVVLCADEILTGM